MANYTTADVKRLRELTGAGMMDCKKALEEADGDFDKAVEFLRIKGAKDIGKRAARATANGLVVADGGVMVELNCETDFVAKNAEFQELANRIVAVAKETKPADVEALRNTPLDGGSVNDAVQELSAKIGEKLELRRVVSFDGPVATYLHRRATDLPPSVGVLVEYTGDSAETARGTAMHIAAMKPRYVSRDEVTEDVVATERRIAEETAREEGKPEQALPKIVEGRVNGFYKDVVLLEQSSVQDAKKTVQAVLDDAGVSVTRFARFEVGQA
ncbi:MAG TPA: translation elongation factor Ts [Actinophytocola sp.]|uniref:translation elongation factor Ts n=1 Tax=Actinophytocola sp. TaxID=1872138 RepID=UPI002DB557DF|nr:translation elongation factor Ts [Actinophytocola sp.]HEU5470340.1 translation elongation factor Ts [Actinophytocola sp.]